MPALANRLPLAKQCCHRPEIRNQIFEVNEKDVNFAKIFCIYNINGQIYVGVRRFTVQDVNVREGLIRTGVGTENASAPDILLGRGHPLVGDHYNLVDAEVRKFSSKKPKGPHFSIRQKEGEFCLKD